MLSWRKTLKLTMNFIYNKDFISKKSKLKDLHLEYVSNSRFNYTLLIKIEDGEDILIDAEAMLTACQKTIDITKI